MASDERRFCYACGTTHRPRENTLCPVTQTIGNTAYSGLTPSLGHQQCYTLDEARAAFEAQGLHVVDAKQWAVLEAARAVPGRALHTPITYAEELFPLCDEIQRWKAELARREAERG